MRPLPVLLTRPAADALRLSDALHAMGVPRVERAPLLRIEPVGPVPSVPGGVLLTSSNAVRSFVALGGMGRGPAWVVGPRTAGLARDAGFDVRAVAPTVEALATLVPTDAPPLVHLRGEVTRGDLAGRLRARGLTVEEAVLYRQVPQPLTPAALDLLRAGPVLVPLYSPRTATLFTAACPPEAFGNLRVLALSRAVADAGPVPPRGICETPDGPAMLTLLREHLRTIDG